MYEELDEKCGAGILRYNAEKYPIDVYFPLYYTNDM